MEHDNVFNWEECRKFVRKFVSNIVPDCKNAFLADTPDTVLGHPVRQDVVHFIANFLYDTGANPEEIFILFKGGYCFYFAKMLETAFGGTIVWEPDASHILWMDENQILYDVEGVRDDILPEHVRSLNDLGNEIHSYMHTDDLNPV